MTHTEHTATQLTKECIPEQQQLFKLVILTSFYFIYFSIYGYRNENLNIKSSIK